MSSGKLFTIHYSFFIGEHFKEHKHGRFCSDAMRKMGSHVNPCTRRGRMAIFSQRNDCFTAEEVQDSGVATGMLG